MPNSSYKEISFRAFLIVPSVSKLNRASTSVETLPGIIFKISLPFPSPATGVGGLVVENNFKAFAPEVPGDDPNANGHAERAVRWMKEKIRTL